MESLHYQLAVIILLSFGNSVDKVWEDMSPTGVASDPRKRGLYP